MSDTTDEHRDAMNRYPWRDSELMEELYVEEQLSTRQISDEAGLRTVHGPELAGKARNRDAW